MKAWVYQDDKQVKKHGVAKASWYVGWLDPAGKRRCQSCGPGAAGKSTAEKVRKRVEAELLTGTYQRNDRKTWGEFRQEYEEKVLPKKAIRSQTEMKVAFAHFERLIKPGKVSAIKTSTIDEFSAKRREEGGKKGGELVSPFTVNKDLRHLKAALRKAHRWGYLPTVPEFDFLKQPRKLPTYVTPDHFAAVYQACDHARLPNDLPYPAADWWRGLLVMGYMTGWRISDLLGLRRNDLDLEKGTAITRAEDNKGDRDELVKLHVVVVEHLRKLASFDPHVFPWNCNRRTLDVEFHRIQKVSGFRLACSASHEHTEACHYYGFHDLRRAFATMNAAKLTPDALQALMRHKSYLTTQVYINIGRQMDEAVASLHVPDVLKTRQAGG